MTLIKSARDRLTALKFRIPSPNPVIVREMRARMRGPRAFWLLTGYLTALGLVAYGLYRIMLATMQYQFGFSAPPQSAFIGQSLFVALAFMELLFICFLTPALTAGSISGEVERRTYDMLLATPLGPGRIVVGKLIASLTYALLLILAAIPLASVIFLFGGIALRDVAQAIGLMFVVTVAYGAVGVFFSALVGRTSWAAVLSYAVVLALTFGSIFVWGVLSALGEGEPAPHGYLYLSPLTAMASAIFSPSGSMGMQNRGPSGFFQIFTLGDFIFEGPARPLWHYTTALYLAMTAILVVLATQFVKPVRRWQFNRRALRQLLLLLILLTAALVVIFGTSWGVTDPRASFPVAGPAERAVMPAVPGNNRGESNEGRDATTETQEAAPEGAAPEGAAP